MGKAVIKITKKKPRRRLEDMHINNFYFGKMPLHAIGSMIHCFITAWDTPVYLHKENEYKQFAIARLVNDNDASL